MDERRQKKRRQRQPGGSESACGRGLGARVEVHHRAREAPGDRKAAGKGRAKVGAAEADQLLIRVDPLAFLCGQGLRHADALDKADDRDQQRRDEELRQQVGGEGGQGERRQALRHFPHDRNTPRTQIEAPDRQRRGQDRQHRPGFGPDIRHLRPQPHAPQQRFQSAAHPEQEGRGGQAQAEGDDIDLPQMRPEARQDLRQGMPLGLDPQNMPQLAGGDQDAGGGDEARDHRVRQEIRQKPQPKQPKRQQHRTRQKGQRQRRRDIARRAALRDLAHRRRRHQRDHGHRPHRQRAAGAKDGVEHDGRDGGIDPGLGRHPRQKRIGQRLRDQHDRHDHRRDHIPGELAAVIAPPPVEDRQVVRKRRERHGRRSVR